MRARIVFHETGTGESETFDTEIAELTANEVLAAFERLQRQCEMSDDNVMKLKAEAFFIQGDSAAFILSSHDPVWFGDMLWTGVVYTLFAGVAERTC